MHYVKYNDSLSKVELDAFKEKMSSIFGDAIVLKPKKTKKTFTNWQIILRKPTYWADSNNAAYNFIIYGIKFRKKEDTILFRMVFGISE